jgi:hypothetical protein
MTEEDLGGVKVSLLKAMKQGRALGAFLAIVAHFPPENPKGEIKRASWHNIPLDAITRGRPLEQLPALNQLILKHVISSGNKPEQTLSPHGMGKAYVKTFQALDKVHKLAHWLACVWVFPPTNANQVGAAAIWDMLPLAPIRAVGDVMRPLEDLPTLNIALLVFMEATGTKVINVQNTNGVLVAGQAQKEEKRIIMP